MLKRRKANANPTMYIDDRLSDGHIVVCTGDGTEHSFCRRRLDLSVECPICGQFALSVDLTADFYRRLAGGARDHLGRKRPKMSVFPLPRQRRWQPRQGREALVPTG